VKRLRRRRGMTEERKAMRQEGRSMFSRGENREKSAKIEMRDRKHIES